MAATALDLQCRGRRLSANASSPMPLPALPRSTLLRPNCQSIQAGQSAAEVVSARGFWGKSAPSHPVPMRAGSLVSAHPHAARRARMRPLRQFPSAGISDYPKLFSLCSVFVLDVRRRTNIIAAVPYRYGARRGGPAAWNGARRSANFAGLGRLSRISGPRRGGRGGPRQRARTARVDVRATARTNGVKSTAATRSWDIQQADKSIRVRNAGERLLPRP
jgi:hypothetical protein